MMVFKMLNLNPAVLNAIRFGAKDMMPMSVAAATYGMAFGLFAMQSGFSFLQTFCMSAFVFAGASQMITLDQVMGGSSVVAAVTAGAAVNMRILLVTAAMNQALRYRPWWQISLGAFLATDASVALMQTAKKHQFVSEYWYLVGGGLSLLVVWIFSTVLGALLTQGIPNPERYGLDFAIIAVFMALIPGFWRGNIDLLPWSITVSFVVFFAYIFPDQASWGLIFGAILGAAAAGLRHGY